LRHEELGDSYSSPNTIRVLTSRKMRWAGHTTGTGENRNAHTLLAGKPKRKRSLERRE